jgi:hypothetical protein
MTCNVRVLTHDERLQEEALYIAIAVLASLPLGFPPVTLLPHHTRDEMIDLLRARTSSSIYSFQMKRAMERFAFLRDVQPVTSHDGEVA